MDPALIEMVRDIPKDDIDRVLREESFSRWTYYADAEAGQAGIIFANDESLALYVPEHDSTLKPGPTGKLELTSLRYVPSSHQLYIERSGEYLTLQVFSNPDQAGQDTAAALDWQQFLADHAVPKMTVPATVQPVLGGSLKRLIIVVVAIVLVVVLASVVFISR